MPLDGVISLYRPWTRAAEERIFRAQVTNKMPLGSPAASQDPVADKSDFFWSMNWIFLGIPCCRDPLNVLRGSTTWRPAWPEPNFLNGHLRVFIFKWPDRGGRWEMGFMDRMSKYHGLALECLLRLHSDG